MTEPTHARTAVSLLPGDFVNLGDAMLTLAAARRIAQDGARVTVLPYRLPGAVVRDEFEKEGFAVVSIRDQPWRALRACLRGSIWIGGGHAIRNEISLGWLMFASVLTALARLSGRNVRVIGSGVTPVPSRWRRGLFNIIFWSCDRLCVRDGLSGSALRADFPGMAAKVQLAGDLAFLKGCLTLPAQPVEERACVVSPGIDVREGRTEDPQEILAVLARLVRQFGMRHVIVVSHDSRREYGLPFCQQLAATVKAALPVTVEVIEQGGIQHGLLEPYSRARWIVTGRLHGLIIGALMSRTVFYTAGSAHKLRPFAELFRYAAAARVPGVDAVPASYDGLSAAILTQAAAAELNFRD